MKFRKLLLSTLTFGLILAACGGAPATSAPATTEPVPTTQPPATDVPAPTSPAPSGELVQTSDHPRNTSPSAPQADVTQVADGNNAFALDLYQAIKTNNNLVFSPYSIEQALAMVYAGAKGDTAKQMAATFHFTLDQAKLHPAFNTLDLTLTQPATDTEQGTPFQLSIANSIWGQQGYTFLPDFLDVLAENYGAGLRLADFKTAAEPARVLINQWVSDQTKDKIKDLFPAGSITDHTRLVLANAIYFKATWQHTFEPTATQPANFTLLDGSTVSVPMMNATEAQGLDYVKGSNYQAVSLPYLGDKQSMLIILPDSGAFADIQASLTADSLKQLQSSLEVKQVQLSMPKFTFSTDTPLADTLSSLGMTDAFLPDKADFSGMDGTHDLFISAVLHKAFIAVDEQGTEAAAATGVVVGTMAMPVTDVQLTIDHPYLFFIRDNATGTILFMGQVLNPNS